MCERAAPRCRLDSHRPHRLTLPGDGGASCASWSSPRWSHRRSVGSSTMTCRTPDNSRCSCVRMVCLVLRSSWHRPARLERIERPRPPLRHPGALGHERRDLFRRGRTVHIEPHRHARLRRPLFGERHRDQRRLRPRRRAGLARHVPMFVGEGLRVYEVDQGDEPAGTHDGHTW